MLTIKKPGLSLCENNNFKTATINSEFDQRQQISVTEVKRIVFATAKDDRAVMEIHWRGHNWFSHHLECRVKEWGEKKKAGWFYNTRKKNSCIEMTGEEWEISDTLSKVTPSYSVFRDRTVFSLVWTCWIKGEKESLANGGEVLSAQHKSARWWYILYHLTPC